MMSAHRPTTGSIPLLCVMVDALCGPRTGVSGFGFFEEGISV
jgi:hypothetical protein